MSDFVAAFGLFLVIEGLIYGGFPHLTKTMAANIGAIPEPVMRLAGTVSVALGVFVVWMVRG